MFRKFLVTLSVLGIILSSGIVSALGLGQIKVQSALNQILQAEIELVGVSADEIDEVRVELASQQVFERLGIPRNFELTRLQFKPALSGGQTVIKVTSKDPIREPFLTFLVQVQWAKGRMLREYTVLLDPPVFGQQARAQMQAPVAEPVKKKAPPPDKPEPSKSQPVAVSSPSTRQPILPPAPKSSPKPDPQAGPDEYQSRKGDTLWSIAEQITQSRGGSVNQMMVAIQSRNQNAFIGGNINNLKAGQILRVPSHEQVNAISESDATSEVKRQWLEWQQSRQQTIQPSEAVPVEKTSPPQELVTTRSAEPKAVEQSVGKTYHETDAQLSIVGEDTGATQGGTAEPVGVKQASAELEQKIALLREQSEAKNKENEELQSRIAALESLLKKQERIITLQSKKLDQLQTTFADGDSATLLEPATGEPNVTDTIASESTDTAARDVEEVVPTVDESLVGELPVDTASQGAELAEAGTDEVRPAVVEPLPDFSEPLPDEFAQLEEELFGSDTEEETTTAMLPEQDSTASQTMDLSQVAGEDAAPVSSAIEQWKDKLLSMIAPVVDATRGQGRNAVIAGGGILAIVLGWLALRGRRQNKKLTAGKGMPTFSEMDDSLDDEVLDETIVANSRDERNADEFDDIDIQEEDTIVSSKKSASAKNDEVLEEADVYISYSLFQQAEDLLEEAISKNPNHVGYRYKLAEVLKAAGKKNEFVKNAEKIMSLTNKDSEHWKGIVAMGAALVPGNSMFASSVPASAGVVNQSPAPQEPDFDLDADQESDMPSRDDMSLDFELDDASTAAASTESAAISESEDDSSGFDMDESDENELVANNDADAEDDSFIDFDADDLEQELTGQNVSIEDAETEELSEFVNSNSDDNEPVNETVMFDSNALHDDDQTEDISEGMTQEISSRDLTRELETLNFDADEFEESSLPTLETQELSSRNLDNTSDSEDEDLAASETGTFSAEMFSGDETEQFDISNIDTELVDLSELRERGAISDQEEDLPSMIEEAGTKLDLARAFVDMGDPDAARETLTEVLEQGDDSQIREAKALLDRIT